jgi:hypothetical protein
MPSQCNHPVTSLDIHNVQCLPTHQKQQTLAPYRHSELPGGKRCISVPAGERDLSQGGSSVASTVQGQNSTPSLAPNYSHIADITRRATSTRSATQRWSIITPTTTPDISSRNTPEPNLHRETQCVALYPAPHPALLALPLLSAVLKTIPTPIPNPEARAIRTN